MPRARPPTMRGGRRIIDDMSRTSAAASRSRPPSMTIARVNRCQAKLGGMGGMIIVSGGGFSVKIGWEIVGERRKQRPINQQQPAGGRSDAPPRLVDLDGRFAA